MTKEQIIERIKKVIDENTFEYSEFTLDSIKHTGDMEKAHKCGFDDGYSIGMGNIQGELIGLLADCGIDISEYE